MYICMWMGNNTQGGLALVIFIMGRTKCKSELKQTMLNKKAVLYDLYAPSILSM